MRGLSQIITIFFFIALTITASALVYTFIVQPRLALFNDNNEYVIRYVTPYNSSHVICYVVKGSIEGLVYRNGTWVYGEAFKGDLVVVPKILIEVENR